MPKDGLKEPSSKRPISYWVGFNTSTQWTSQSINQSINHVPTPRASAHWGQMGSADPPEKTDKKLKRENMQKRPVFWMVGGGEGRCRERLYADHIFIQIYFRKHHFVAKFSKFSSPQAARKHWPSLTKILRTLLPTTSVMSSDGGNMARPVVD